MVPKWPNYFLLLVPSADLIADAMTSITENVQINVVDDNCSFCVWLMMFSLYTHETSWWWNLIWLPHLSPFNWLVSCWWIRLSTPFPFLGVRYCDISICQSSFCTLLGDSELEWITKRGGVCLRMSINCCTFLHSMACAHCYFVNQSGWDLVTKLVKHENLFPSW